MKKLLRRIIIGIVAFIVILFFALFIYSRNPYTALEEMDDAIALVDDSNITYYEDRDEIRYSVDNPIKNIIFIPGGLVTPDSYKYLAISLAAEGYEVVIAKAPFNLAILNPFIGKEFLSNTIDNVIIGHSLGGVTASSVFSGNDSVEAMIFLGSYPIKDVKDIFSGDLIQIADDLVFDATVTANDESGNAYKYIYVQDETGGIQVKINQKDLYLRGYTVGQKITVSTKDLYLGQYGGEIQLGSIYNKNIGSIEAEITYKHLYIGEENAPLDATVMTIDNLTPENVGMLVQFNQVQFSQEDVPFADTSSNYPTNRDLLDCNANGLVVRTSKYANFAETTLPAGNGSIYGILNVYNGTYQLLVRDANDFAEMTNTKCDVFASAVQTNLSDIRAKFTGSKINIDENIKITAVITSDKTTGNINGANAFAQDATAGIALRFSGDHSLALGDKVEIALKGVALEEYNGLLQLNYIPLGNIRSTTTGALPTPKAITLAEALTGNYESQLVSIENVEFKVNTGDYSGSNTITDCTDELTMYVSSGATFKDDVVSALKGTIIGVMTEFNGTAQLYLRNTTDINFTDAYVDCSGGNTGGGTGSGADLYISEYAEGSSNNKYLEIYNGTGAAVSLADYSIEVYNNGSLTVTNSLSFTNGETIAAGDVFVVYNISAVATIVDAGDISSTITYFNGDDAVVLLKSGVVIDAVGIIGVDPGSAWDVAGVAGATANHTLVRKSSVTSGNADWTASAGTNVDDSEWEVKANDDWTNLGIR